MPASGRTVLPIYPKTAKKNSPAFTQSHIIGRLGSLFSAPTHEEQTHQDALEVAAAQAAIPMSSKLSFQPLPTTAGSKNPIFGKSYSQN